MTLAVLAGVSAERVGAAPAWDGETPDGFEVVPLPGFFQVATAFVFAPDGGMMIAEKGGRLRWKPGDAAPPQFTPVLDIRDEVDSFGDRGLNSLALHPGWEPDGGSSSWVYLAYAVGPVPGTETAPGENDQYTFGRLTRYRTQTIQGEVLADHESRQVLLGNQLPDGSVPDAYPCVSDSHESGALLFGVDGSLLMGVGEGSYGYFVDTGGNDAPAFDDFVHPGTGLRGPHPAEQDSGALRAQDLRSLGGKILRLDPETGDGYPSNPFFDGDSASNASRVWALGLRSPFRMSIDPPTGSTDPADGKPGRLWVGDVGWGQSEEIDRCDGGENFGWPCWEGMVPTGQYSDYVAPPGPYALPDCSQAPAGVLTSPLVVWHHEDPALLEPPLHVDGEGSPGAGFTGECVIAGPAYAGGSYPQEYVGRVFVGDYVGHWVRTVELDGNGDPVALRDFTSVLEPLVDIQLNPLTGDVYYLGLPTSAGADIHRIRFSSNLTPIAVAQGAPVSGDAPLAVQFDGSASSDPDDQPLTYLWDFGDGSDGSSDVAPAHVYAYDGVYLAQLTVGDPSELTSKDEVIVTVGDVVPQAVMISPAPNEVYVPGQPVSLVGAGVDPQGGELSYEWTVDLVHDTHFHPGHFVAQGQTAVLQTEQHGSPGDLGYYRVGLEVSDGESFTGEEYVYIYPVDRLHDPTGSARPIARVLELYPPYPMGPGNRDAEVVRDDDWPSLGVLDTKRQFDSFHLGQQLADDWAGWEWDVEFAGSSVFVGLTFQEGMHFPGGGWWDSFHVEVRQGGEWVPATGFRVQPPYPFELSGTPGFDGQPYETYSLTFDPLPGDAIRMRGDPGGLSSFVSLGELRVVMARPDPGFDPYVDITPQGVFVARVLELSPPAPQGDGNTNPETLRNGTWPPVGSTSEFAQYDAEHGGDQAGLDWMGWEFETPRLFARVRFQEGLHQAQGGWLQDLGVEVRNGPEGTWTPVTGLSIDPAYVPSGDLATSYRPFELTFTPVVGDAVRVSGVPGGAKAYMSSGELLVEEPAWTDPACGIEVIGAGLGGVNVLELACGTVPIPGAPFSLEVRNALPNSLGALLVAHGASTTPLFAGTVLVDFGQMVAVVPLQANGAGTGSWSTVWLSGPNIDHSLFVFQAGMLDMAAPFGFLLSNALAVTPCTWPGN